MYSYIKSHRIIVRYCIDSLLRVAATRGLSGQCTTNQISQTQFEVRAARGASAAPHTRCTSQQQSSPRRADTRHRVKTRLAHVRVCDPLLSPLNRSLFLCTSFRLATPPLHIVPIARPHCSSSLLLPMSRPTPTTPTPTFYISVSLSAHLFIRS